VIKTDVAADVPLSGAVSNQIPKPQLFSTAKLSREITGASITAPSAFCHGSVLYWSRLAIKEIKIVSGGQTGADRAALDFAIKHGFEHGGWCPKGRFAEDGPLADRYALQETPTQAYPQRTEWNVRDSDGTVVLTIATSLSGGSRQTYLLAKKYKKPVLHLSREGGPASPEKDLRLFIRKHRIRVLNVAGPRASEEPEVAAFVKEVLKRALV
jgi:hypothetical protein